MSVFFLLWHGNGVCWGHVCRGVNGRLRVGVDVDEDDSALTAYNTLLSRLNATDGMPDRDQ